jgi:hypothetical protein
MNLTDAIDVLVLTIQRMPVQETVRNLRMRSRSIDFNFRTTNPR